ncbi:hypothetical protein cand_034380, partial [Cryptosporidium andersoni]
MKYHMHINKEITYLLFLWFIVLHFVYQKVRCEDFEESWSPPEFEHYGRELLEYRGHHHHNHHNHYNGYRSNSYNHQYYQYNNQRPYYEERELIESNFHHHNNDHIWDHSFWDHSQHFFAFNFSTSTTTLPVTSIYTLAPTQTTTEIWTEQESPIP